ncbi:MAG TPA: hypothetical protein VK614_06350 [Allosphingosinicella sp.]|nr:hypothetical protein [Allosphingosinicella sp.]
MTYGIQGFGDPELEAFDFEGFGGTDGEGFGDPFEPEGFGPGDTFGGGNGGALARIDSETAAMLMDMYSTMAAEAESEEEADAFLPLIAGLAPMAMNLGKKLFAKAAPKMSRGVMSAGRKMFQRFGKKGMEALPDIARGVARDSLQRVADGQELTGDMVMRSAAQHTVPFLQDPQQLQQAAHHCRRRYRHAQQHRPQQPYGPPPSPYGPPGYGPPPSPYGPSPYGAPPYGEPQSPYGAEQAPYGGQPPQMPQWWA